MEDFKIPQSKAEVMKMFGDETSEIPKRCLNVHLDLIKELRQIKEDMRPLEARKNYIENQLAVYMMDSEMLVDEQGTEIASWRFDAGRRFSQSKFREENELLYNKYCTEKTRRFLIK